MPPRRRNQLPIRSSNRTKENKHQTNQFPLPLSSSLGNASDFVPPPQSDKGEFEEEPRSLMDVSPHKAHGIQTGPKRKKSRFARPSTSTNQNDPKSINLSNYEECDLDFSTIDELLAVDNRKINNRIPPAVQQELKNLQLWYRRMKKLMALIGHCSENTINEFLHEVSVRTKRTFYQNFLKYSLESTTETHMPPRNQSEGFLSRNQHLGGFWTNLDFDQKNIYNEKIFYLLGYLACGWPLPARVGSEKALSEEEIEKYLPIYKKNVNIEKVASDLGKGKFGPDFATANQNKGVQEIQRIDDQLQVISIRYGVHYSLLACSWNPNTRNEKAHWDAETSSCEEWIHLSRSKWHLLEWFVRQTIKAEPTKPIERKPQSSDLIKKRLTSSLNQLVTSHLEPPYSLRDCHPKTANPHLVISTRKFGRGVSLKVERTLQCRMTDLVLQKKYESMTVATYQMWQEDVDAGHYKVVRVDDTEDSGSTRPSLLPNNVTGSNTLSEDE